MIGDSLDDQATTMELSKRLPRFATVGILLFVVALGLTGCVSAPTGRNASATNRQIESVPGVDKASVQATTLHDGLTNPQTIIITVTVRDGYRVGDADAAVVWLAREAWSAGPRRPGSMGISLEDSSGKPLNWDWKAALAKRGLDTPLNDANMPRLLTLAGTSMFSLTGKSWPGPVPKTPANLFVKQ